MKRNILNLEGVKILDKNEQKDIDGGFGSLAGCLSLTQCQLTCNMGRCMPNHPDDLGNRCYECDHRFEN